jgi:hypothetical protein
MSVGKGAAWLEQRIRENECCKLFVAEKPGCGTFGLTVCEAASDHASFDFEFYAIYILPV